MQRLSCLTSASAAHNPQLPTPIRGRRSANTRRAYARACTRFFAWCEERGLTLTTIRPHDVATYIETRHQTHSAPDVKQQLAAVRMLFDWLITGQIVPVNPAAAVRGPTRIETLKQLKANLGIGIRTQDFQSYPCALEI
jgi:site-specific recombinase XerD